MKNWIIIAVVAAAAIGLLIYGNLPKPASAAMTEFAQCLSEKGAVMYGAEWCPHCQNEKKAFGDAFKYITYVECPENLQLCIDAGIDGYPTWTFPGGIKLEGEQGIAKLAQVSTCSYAE